VGCELYAPFNLWQEVFLLLFSFPDQEAFYKTFFLYSRNTL